MIICQFIYIWPTSFTKYETVEVTWRARPSELRLKIYGSKNQDMNPLQLGEAGEFESASLGGTNL